MNERILIADDDQRSLKLLNAILVAEGYSVLAATDGKQAFDLLLTNPVDLVISDILMPNIDGYYLCFKIRTHERLKNIPVIIYSGTFTSPGEESKAKQMGADEFIRKPAPRSVILEAVKKMLLTERSPSSLTGQEGIHQLYHQHNHELIQKLEQRNSDLEEIKSKLEQLVSERTRNLDNVNEELAATNEELRASNEELSAMNDQLGLANDEIQKQADIIIKQKEDALKSAQQNLHVIFENTQEGICVINRDGDVLFFNRMLEELSMSAIGGKPRVGMKMWQMTSPEREEIVRQNFLKGVKGEILEWQTTMPFRGKPTTMQTRQSPVFIDGRVEFVTLTLTDITEKKQQEVQLKQSEFNLRTIFENTTDSFTLIDEHLHVLAFNKVSALHSKMLYGMEVHVGASIFDFLPKEGHSNFKETLERVKNGEVVSGDARIYLQGVEKWLMYNIKAVRNSEGKLYGYCMASHDITPIKKAEAEIIKLNKSLTDFQQAIQRSSIVSMTDAAGRITFVNENFIDISGFSRNELLGKDHSVINSGFHPNEFWIEMWKTIRSGEVWRAQVRNRRKNGSMYWVDTFIMPFVNDAGEVYEYLSIRHDITGRKENEEELQQKRALLEEAARVAKIGYWVYHMDMDELNISREMLSILDVSEAEYIRDRASLYQNVLNDEIKNDERLTHLRRTPQEKAELEFSIKRKDGNIRWISQKADVTKVISNDRLMIGVVQDITERKQIERVLSEYNERFDILSKATNDAIWDLDMRLNLVIWNHAIFDVFGYNEKQIEYHGDWWTSKIHPEDLNRVQKGFEESIRTKSNTWTSKFRFCCADGTYKNVSNRSYILYENEAPVRVIGALEDISDRVAATAEIEKLSLVASRTNNGVIITDANGIIEWVNEGFHRMTGYSFNEAVGKDPSFLQGEETDKAVAKGILYKLKNRELVSEELINYTKSGNKIWLKLDIAPVFDDDQRLRNFISVQSDITALKDFEDSITSIARELRSLISNANVPIFSIDNTGAINVWNRVCTDLLEFTEQEAVGSHWKNVLGISSEFQPLFEKQLQDAVENAMGTNFELPLRTKNGKHVIVLVSASARRAVNSQVTGIILVGQNITELTDYRNNLEQKVTERTIELHAALEKEKSLVKIKNQFVSIASHEFRTPLTGIFIAAEFIKRYKGKLSNEAIDEKISSIEKQVNHMTYLLDDILMVGKAEAGKIVVNMKVIQIAEFVNDLAEEVMKTSGNTHRIEISGKLTYREIPSDEKLLRNILINLMTNAIKFSPKASHINVTLQCDLQYLTIEVQDNGIGIPQEDMDNLFQPFYRAGNVESIQGTGLGLSIIKKAVELLDGQISVTSEVGVGTKFTVKLPI